MRNKFFAVFGCCLLILACLSGAATVSAQNADIAVDEVQNLIDGIVAYKEAESGVNSIQDWIDAELAENAGMTSEWYIMALAQTGENYNFSSYVKALKKYINSNTFSDATNRQKYALALVASGRANDEYVTSTVEDSIGRQGIMSWIYGMHLANNGIASETYTIEAMIHEILALRLADGGWALYGENSDIDVTAMAIQAISPYYSNEPIKTAVDEALNWLGSKQQDDGGYAGFGAGNPESAAQVMMALSALGIDCTKDSRFFKNGNTLIDGMLKFRLADDSFSHVEGGVSNHNATVQAFQALIAFLRLQKGQGPLFIFDKPLVFDGAEQAGNPIKGYKFWVSVSAAGIALLICLLFIIIKKTHFKNFLAVFIAAALIIAFVQLTDFSAASDFYNGQDADKGNIIGMTTMTICCDTVVGKSDSNYIPVDGVILPATQFEIAEGDTVYDILIEAARKYGIQVENGGTREMAYVAGINYLYEYQFGDLSGWVFHVNGIAPSVGCGEFALSDGDEIEWLYTCALGNDLG